MPSSLNTSCSCSSFLIYDNGIKINSTTCSKSYTLHKVDFFTQKLTFYCGLHVIKVGRTNTCMLILECSFIYFYQDDNTVSISTNSVQICVEDIPQNVTIDYPSVFFLVSLGHWFCVCFRTLEFFLETSQSVGKKSILGRLVRLTKLITMWNYFFLQTL